MFDKYSCHVLMFFLGSIQIHYRIGKFTMVQQTTIQFMLMELNNSLDADLNITVDWALKNTATDPVSLRKKDWL